MEDNQLFDAQERDENRGSNRIDPHFNFHDHGLTSRDIITELKELNTSFDAIPHDKLFHRMLDQIKTVDYRKLVGFKDEKVELSHKHFLVSSIEHILGLAHRNCWGLCKNQGITYLYNGAFWKAVDIEELKNFLCKAVEKMGIDKYQVRYHSYRDELYKQFQASAYLPKPEPSHGVTLINLKNGTFEVGEKSQTMRPPRKEDFLTYQLPFEYNPSAIAPLFQSYLDKVQPDIECQMILAEYLGYIFTHSLKLEKTLLLYGSGANGKSVFFHIMNALLGPENTSSFSLQSLTASGSYQRAELANKLVNYASEISGKLEVSNFKLLVSGEPIEARYIYGSPFIMKRYAKLIFNCNELPKDVEQSHAYFRRFLIVPFDVIIPDEQQDKQLANKIIQSELPGVFNWVLSGLQRLLKQGKFTQSRAVQKQLEDYKRQSDSVQLFLQDEGYVSTVNAHQPLKELFQQYKTYCSESNHLACSIKTFGDRLRNAGCRTERKMKGHIVYVHKKEI